MIVMGISCSSIFWEVGQSKVVCFAIVRDAWGFSAFPPPPYSCGFASDLSCLRLYFQGRKYLWCFLSGGRCSVVVLVFSASAFYDSVKNRGLQSSWACMNDNAFLGWVAIMAHSLPWLPISPPVHWVRLAILSMDRAKCCYVICV